MGRNGLLYHTPSKVTWLARLAIRKLLVTDLQILDHSHVYALCNIQVLSGTEERGGLVNRSFNGKNFLGVVNVCRESVGQLSTSRLPSVQPCRPIYARAQRMRLSLPNTNK